MHLARWLSTYDRKKRAVKSTTTERQHGMIGVDVQTGFSAALEKRHRG
jgi:hypothetical protein